MTRTVTSSEPRRSPNAAAYERVAARILARGERHIALAFTSSVAGEGVTSTAVGVALALAAATDRSVLLVDANLRTPRAHLLLNVPESPGLPDAIANYAQSSSASLFDPVEPRPVGAYRTAVPNLWVVPSGGARTRPAEVLTCEAAAQHLAHLRATFDYVIIDCPPLLSAVEAESVCRYAGTAAMVVKQGSTPRSQIARARETIDGVPVMGAVLNGG